MPDGLPPPRHQQAPHPQDLAAIGTLGFRGEALAAIAAVARVELLTRPAGGPAGHCPDHRGGEVFSQEPAGRPLGTTLVVRDLFYNTPARLKFMKRDAAEGAAVFALVQKLALSHPEVALKFFRDGKQELMTPGDGKLASALYAVLGRDMALGYTPVQGGGEEMSVTGYVSLPACRRGTGRISTSSSTAGTSSPNSSPPPWSGPMRTRRWWASSPAASSSSR